MNLFQLHPRLEQDCLDVGHFALCKILLMNDCQYPWLILVPRRHDVTEIYQLAAGDRQQLLDESCWLAEALVAIYRPDKLNIAAIGNLVPQLHLHHVVRYRADIAWPGPIWGKFAASAYTKPEAETQIARLREHLQGRLVNHP
ncbi:MAG: HIT domain-containing protein [Methylomonas sp.]|jgi:diadenosine tetraphosphate (Ap4A) HIT family hydrolase|uniref:HIT domain-containing protein n=1 Tax=Methylomonas sp. TaxID=418 RepID=UPI0025DFA202|nr:HIT domain-containing protein [Methylomonas sp.]MCK9607137.1 HIT domain-containing protein [Methylomonas sp.]